MWFYEQNGGQKGPIEDAELSSLMAAGTVRPDTLVWREGQAGWQPAIDVVPQHMRPDATGAPPPLPADAPSDRTVGSTASVSEPTSNDFGSSHAKELRSGPIYHPQGFMESVKTVFSKYATFRGRARRPEFWYFVLFNVLMGFVTGVLDALVFPISEATPINSIFTLVVLLPSIAVTARRLHDIGRSGWWQLIWLVPIIGWIIVIYWAIQKSDPGPNEYGPE